MLTLLSALISIGVCWSAQSIDDIIRGGVKIYGVDQNGVPFGVLTDSAKGLKVYPSGPVEVTGSISATFPPGIALDTTLQGIDLDLKTNLSRKITDGVNTVTVTSARALSTDILSSLQSSRMVTQAANVALTSVVVAQANPLRRCLYVWNNSSNSAYLTLGPVSNGNTPTQIVATFTSFVMAQGPVYTGTVSAIRNSGTGLMTAHECMP